MHTRWRKRYSTILGDDLAGLSLVVATAFVLLTSGVCRGQKTGSDVRTTQPPLSVRLYVMDCGTLHFRTAVLESFHLKSEDVATTDMSIPWFRISSISTSVRLSLLTSLVMLAAPTHDRLGNLYNRLLQCFRTTLSARQWQGAILLSCVQRGRGLR
jgi:hypothetical protein